MKHNDKIENIKEKEDTAVNPNLATDKEIQQVINEEYEKDNSINNGGKTDYYQLENAPFKINDFDDFAEWIGVIPELTEENINSLYAGYLVLDHLIKEKGSKVKGLAAYKGSIKNYKPVHFTLKVEKELNKKNF